MYITSFPIHMVAIDDETIWGSLDQNAITKDTPHT
jgi:hypothetical protein